MTTSTKNTLTLTELLGEGSREMSWNELREDGEHNNYTFSDGRKRTHADTNWLLNGDTMVRHGVPSCFKARETVEWEEYFQTYKEVILETSEDKSISLDAAFTALLHVVTELVIDSVEGVPDLDTYMSSTFANNCVAFWAMADAWHFLSKGEFIEEGSTKRMRINPISQDLYGVGGRIFASDMWDFIVAARENAITTTCMASRKLKPVSKAAKKKAAQKASKKARRNARN